MKQLINMTNTKNTNSSTSGGTINSGRSCNKLWHALASSSRWALLKTEMNTHSLTQITKLVISVSLIRYDSDGLKCHTQSGFCSL